MKVSPILPVNNDIKNENKWKHCRLYTLICMILLIYICIIYVAITHNYNEDCEEAVLEYNELILQISQIYNQLLVILSLNHQCYLYLDTGNFDSCILSMIDSKSFLLTLDNINADITIVHDLNYTYTTANNIEPYEINSLMKEGMEEIIFEIDLQSNQVIARIEECLSPHFQEKHILGYSSHVLRVGGYRILCTVKRLMPRLLPPGNFQKQIQIPDNVYKDFEIQNSEHCDKLYEYITCSSTDFSFITISLLFIFTSINFMVILRIWYTQYKHIGDLNTELMKEKDVRSSFIRYIFHELRGLMNSITIATDEIKDVIDNADETKEIGQIIPMIDLVQTSNSNVLEILNDTLDLDKIINNKVDFNKNYADIVSICKKLYKCQNILCRSKSITLTLDVNTPKKKMLIYIDEKRILQVFNNLLSNAQKFTDAEGAIEISLKLTPLDNTELCDVILTINDNGIGISAEDLSILFKPYSQLRKGICHTRGGSGLGLSIAKMIIEKGHNGTLLCHSQENKGSSFIIKFRTKFISISTVEQEHAQSNTFGEAFCNLTIPINYDKNLLLIDDSVVSLKLLARVFKKMGCSLDTAMNGEEALKLLETTKYQVIICDNVMPVMNGIEFCRIKSKKYQNSGALIGLTGNSTKEDTDEFLNAGAQTVIHKPLTKEIQLKILKLLTISK